jgi:hypothetical protein
MAVVHIWEYDGRRFRVMMSKHPFNIIIQESVGGLTNWVTLDEKLFEDLAHEGLDPLMIRAYDIIRVLKTVCNVVNDDSI